MRKRANTLLSFVIFLTAFTSIFAQSNAPALLGEKCLSDFRHKELLQNDPSYVLARQQEEQFYQNFLKTGIPSKAVATIPVVVHVMHIGEAIGTGTNISNAQIQSAINNLNDAFGGTGGYNTVNTNIQFCLAQRDPSNNSTTGINRVNASSNSDYATNGISSANEVSIKAMSKWDKTKYYNIWIVYKIDGSNGAGTQGYAYFPGAGSSTDGAVILANAFGFDPSGSLGYNLKSYTRRNGTATHEIGHAFSLYHTFQGDGSGGNCPTDSDCGTNGDCVSDTPKHKRSNSDCPANSTTNPCQAGSTALDFVHNFMDYSSETCGYQFSAGQSTRMNATVQSGGGRYSLTQSLGCTPVNALDAGISNIVSPTSTFCKGTLTPVVTLKNYGSTTITSVTISYNADGGTNQVFNWTGSLTNGAEVDVTLTPAITVANGNHTFTATTSNPNGGTDQLQSNDTKTGNFTVSAASIPLFEGFETTTFVPTGWSLAESPVGYQQWQRYTGSHANGASTGVAALIFDGGSNLAGNKDMMITEPYDLTGTNNPKMTFKRAAKYFPSTARYDTLKIYISTDCGVTFSQVYSKGGPALATAGTSNSIPNSWYPTSQSNYQTDTINLLSYIGESVVFKFEHIEYGAQNIFIDDINLIDPCNTPNTPGVISGPSSGCSTTTVTYSIAAVTDANTYTWTVPSGSTIQSGQGTTSITVLLGTTSGNVTVTAGSNCGTSPAQQKAITVNNVPGAPGTISGQATVCENATNITYSISAVASATGYTWTVPAGASIVSGQNTPSITVNFGTTSGNVTVTASNSCGAGAANSLAITVNTLPAAASAITGNSAVCANSTGQTYSISASTGATNYTWTVPSGANITAGQGSTSITVSFGSTAGSIQVTPSNSCGNGTASSKAISINNVPSNTNPVSGPTQVCLGAGVQNYSIPTDATATSYIWTVPSGATVQTGQGTNAVTVQFGANSGNVSVTANNTCGASSSQTQAVTIIDTPTTPGSISGVSTICTNASGVTYSIAAVGSATSYTWTVPSGATITAGQNTTQITVSFGSASGNITVTAGNSCGTSAASTLAVTVNSAPSSVGPISGNTTVCSGDAGQVYSVAAGSGASSFAWTVPTGATIGSGQGTNSITVTFGSTSGNVEVTPTYSCGVAPVSTLSVTVNSVPTLQNAMTGPAFVCIGSGNQSYSIPSSVGATNYTWTVPASATLVSGQGTNAVQVLFSTSGGNITVTASNGCGNSATITKAVTVAASAAVPDSIVGNRTVCASSTGNSYSIFTPEAGTTYQWTVPGGATITSGQGTSAILVSFATNGGSISVTGTTSCGTSPSKTANISINPLSGSATAISGNASACANTAGMTYSIPTVSNATNYLWTVPMGFAITSGQGTATITVSSGTQGGNITVTPSNSCGNGQSSTKAFSVTPATTYGTISGPASVCQANGNVFYTLQNVQNANSVTWSVPSGSTIVNGQGTNTIELAFGGTGGTITAQVAGSCNSGQEQFTVSVGSSPAQPSTIAGPSQLCGNSQTVTYSVPFDANATNYQWTVPAGATIVNGQGTSGITVNFGAQGGNVSVVVSNACGAANAVAKTVQLNDIPAQPSIITGPSNICGNTSGHMFSIVNEPSVSFYSWTVPQNAIINQGQGSNQVSVSFGTGGNSISVTATNSCGVSIQRFHSIVINNAPNITSAISGVDEHCSAEQNTYSIPSVSGASTYTWTVPVNTTIVSGQGTNSVLIQGGATSGNITVKASNACGNSNTVVKTLTMKVSPTITRNSRLEPSNCDEPNGNIGVTPNQSGMLTFTGPVSGSTNVAPPNYLIDSLSSGNYTISLMGSNGCQSNVLQEFLNEPQPIRPTITVGSNNICEGNTVELTSSPGLTYDWNTGDNTVTTQVTQTGNYIVAVTDVNGCTGFSDSTYVVFKPTPVVTLAELDTVCKNHPLLPLSGGSPNGGIYSGNGVNNNIFDPSQFTGGTSVQIYYTYEQNGCSNSDSSEIYVDGCAVLSELNLYNVVLYPNPNTGQFQITYSQEPIAVELFDLTGRIIESSVLKDADKATVQLDAVAKGTYYVRLQFENQTQTVQVRIL